MTFKVGHRALNFTDAARPNWQADGPRPLITDIWYPAVASAIETDQFIGPPDTPLFKIGKVAPDAALIDTPAAFPLILFSHGTGGATKQHSWLATHLAAHGCLVAGVNHHGNTALEPYVVQGFTRFWERATDLTVLLNLLLTTPDFGPRIDQSRIGAAGFSLGGYTVLALAGGRIDLANLQAAIDKGHIIMPPEFPYAQAMVNEFARLATTDTTHRASFRDERIKAVFAIAPAVAQAFSPAGLAPIQIPVSIVVGENDPPPFTDAAYFAQHIPHAEFEVLGGHVAHYTFLAEGTEAGKQLLPHLCNDALGVDRRAVHGRVAEKARLFFEGTLG